MRSDGGRARLVALVVIALGLLTGPIGVLGGAGASGRSVAILAQEPPTPGVAVATPAPPPNTAAATAAQPSFDGIRLQHDGRVLPYGVWKEWPPLLLTMPDGGAWAFFTAQAHKDGGLDALRLYAARFDPERGAWLPAEALPGRNVQFGPSAVVDGAGIVHLVYSDRGSEAPDAFSTLVYTRTDGAGGWETPTPVAPDPAAGHQMMPSAALDGAGTLHVLWRDQRNATPEQRGESPAFGDVFASELRGRAWSDPVQVNDRPSADLNAAWPHVVADGERLVAVWSAYKGTTAEELDRPATRVEWSARPLTDPAGWVEPTPVVEQESGSIGGFLVDVVADPRGGALLAYSRVFKNGNDSTTDVFFRRLDGGAAEWGPHLKVISGDLGYFLGAAVGEDGTAYVGFNYGRDRRVKVGAVALRPGSEQVGPLYLPTEGEEGEQGRPALAAGADGRLWLIYMHADPNSASINLRTIRGVELPG